MGGACGGRRGSPVGYSKTADTPPPPKAQSACVLWLLTCPSAPHSPGCSAALFPQCQMAGSVVEGWASHTSDRGKDSLFRPRSAGR